MASTLACPSPKRKTRVFSVDGIEGDPSERWSALDIEGVGIFNVSVSLCSLRFLTALYLSRNLLETVPSAIGQLSSLMILDVSYNRLRLLPQEIGQLVQLSELVLHNNELRDLPFQLGHLFNLQVLTLHNNPLKDSIARLFSEGTDSLLAFLLNNTPTLSPPPPRYWESSKKSGGQFRTAESFSVLSYNILSDKYTSRSIFGWCPNWALKWSQRRQAILKEIMALDCDIVALQEVETSEYFAFFLPELRSLGFDGVFCAKSRSRTMGEIDSNFVDGCATFYRTSMFQQQFPEATVEFSSLSIKYSNRCEDMLNRAMPKDNVAIIVVLQSKIVAKSLVFVNTHLTWSPEFKDVKLLQSIMLMNEVKNYLDGFSLSAKTCCIICGDFNSLPKSGVYDFMSTGKINISHSDFEPFDYSKVFSSLAPRHNFSLDSTFPCDFSFTNFTYKFKGTIDYIWFSKDNLICDSFLSSISQSDMSYSGCPNPHFPSDHIPVAARLRFLM